MKPTRLVLRSLTYHWRTHLGVVAGVAVATAVLTGALLVGDSVRHTLKTIALQRLGQTHMAMATGDRFFTTALAQRIGAELGVPAAGVLDLQGIAVARGGIARANNVHVLGVDDGFGHLSPNLAETGPAAPTVDVRLADHLGARPGDALILRVTKPSAMPRDVPLGSEADDSVTLNMKLAGVADDNALGRFSLQADQIPPFNAFVLLPQLQKAVKLAGRANVLLVGGGTIEQANASLRKHWTLADADVEVRTLEKLGVVELRSGRVFLDAPVVEAAMKTDGSPPAQPLLTYFVNELANRDGDSTPYSMVTGRSDIKDGEIVVTQWLADDLKLKVGDPLKLTYFVIGPARKLVEQSTELRVSAIVPTEAAGGDRELMPQFPGLADAESSRDWEPGIPIDLNRIREKDEAYWKQHRGTPKAFVNLDWARKTWGNRFGDLTALRWKLSEVDPAKLAATVRANLDPASVGLAFQPVREQALAASSGGTDFGGLFIGLSFFLIVAAVVLTGLLFVFGIEQRSEEVGTLLAVGYTPGQVRRLLMGEGLALAAVGGAAGVALGAGYTRWVLWALANMWNQAVGTSTLYYHAEAATLAIGAVSGVLIAAATMAWVLRRQGRQPARALLATRFGLEVQDGQTRRGGVVWLGLAWVCIVGSLALVATAGAGRGGAAAMTFFGAGSLLLIGTLMLTARALRRAGAGSRRLTTTSLAWRNSGRRRGRSLATITMLACGTFLVVSINAFRHAPDETLLTRGSGTGGYALFGRTSLPVYHDLDTPEGQDALGVAAADMKDVSIVQMRLREGDEASCLNLNAPQTPPLLGVTSETLAGRFTFVQRAEGVDEQRPWAALSARTNNNDDAIPGVLDASVAQWILKKGVGDVVELADERGRPMNIRIVGTLAASILQGFIVVDEKRLTEKFPSLGGYRVMLIDAPAGRAAEVGRMLEDRLQDYGLSTMSGPRRLAMFQAVENTYLSIFGVLGGLGLVLGVVGLGLVVLRNVLERRAELALMRSVGFARRQLGWLVLSEHWALLMLGLSCGLISAVVAIVPALRSPESDVPLGLIAWLLAGIVVSGLVWTALATAAALRGRLVEGLRNE